MAEIVKQAKLINKATKLNLATSCRRIAASDHGSMSSPTNKHANFMEMINIGKFKREAPAERHIPN